MRRAFHVLPIRPAASLRGALARWLRLQARCGPPDRRGGNCERTTDHAAATAARREALAVYERFLRELPKHEGTPEALYFSGLDEEREKRPDQARKRWFTVVSAHPSDRLVPACYYGFGVLFRSEAANDPAKLAFAEQSFREVVKYAASPLARRAQSALDEMSGERGGRP